MKPLWISHRGHKAREPENTLGAFRAATAAGFTALETDLRLTRDGHIVLCHDRTLTRLAGIPAAVDQLSRAELEAVRLAGDARLLFLDQFLREFPGCCWTFDIKRETGAGVVRALHDWARAADAVDWLQAQARFLFWSAPQEKSLRRLFPRAAFYAREAACWRAGLAIVSRVTAWSGVAAGLTYALPPRLGRLALYRPEVVAAYQSRGARVVAYLPDNESDTRAAMAVGVDEILTNHLPLR